MPTTQPGPSPAPAQAGRAAEWRDLRDEQGHLHARLNLRTGVLVIRHRRKAYSWRLPLAQPNPHENIDPRGNPC